ncbi:MAG: 1,4-alpha-glucan branching enzyme, partial [Moritella dasanensis]
GVQRLTADLNQLYQAQAALYQLDCDPAGFEWRLQDNKSESVLAHERISDNGERILVISNFTPIPRDNFRLGIPNAGRYELLLNTDAACYAGSNYPLVSSADSEKVQSQGLSDSVRLTLPPLSTVFYRWLPAS